MIKILFSRAARLGAITALALGIGTVGAFAAKIQGGGVGDWSTLSWPGGVPPGAADEVVLLGVYNNITYDGGASGTVGSISGNSVILTLARDLEAQNLYLREGTLAVGSHRLTAGTLSNSLGPDHSGNGLIRTNQGGTLLVGNLFLGRTGLFTFYPGDTITGKFTTYSTFNTWPDVTVTQDPLYGNRDQGLSIENDAPEALFLGRTSESNQSEITLNWNPEGLDGPIDWTLRWKGEVHVAQLRELFDNKQIKIGTPPAGAPSFTRNDNIFADGGYAYVGFRSGPAIVTSPSTAKLGTPFSADLSGMPNPPGAWVAFAKVGAEVLTWELGRSGWAWVQDLGASKTFTVTPASVGTYEFVYYVNWDVVKRSGVVTVTP